jgi:hypothetical protein
METHEVCRDRLEGWRRSGQVKARAESPPPFIDIDCSHAAIRHDDPARDGAVEESYVDGV